MVQENLGRIRGRISLACKKIDCDPESITIVCVTKGRGVEQIREALAAGITDIGENRVQEALIKYNELYAKPALPAGRRYPLSAIKWHMVGHLQTNKVKEAVGMFDLIQSVDSARLAVEIDKQAERLNKSQDILLEIKTSAEETKSGVKPDEAIEVIKEISRLKNINIKGLMTIAPIVDNPEKARPYFRTLRELKDKINSLNAPCLVGRQALSALSMGMSDDFEIAIEEGATMVRLGRAIFE